MKDIKQIREKYDLITEKDESETNRLDQLAHAGLFESKKISFLKRALNKEAAKMTSADKKVMLEFIDVLLNQVLENSNEELLEEKTKDYLSKFDPRFTKWPSDSEIPVVLLLKRKSIRIFPDMQKVALYYAQAIDKYVTIPFGAGVMNEAKEDDEDKKKKRYAPYEKFQAPFRDRSRESNLAKVSLKRVDPNQGGPATERKNKILRKAIRGTALKSAADKFGQGDFNAAAAAVGFAAGSALRAGAKKLFASKKPTSASSPKPAPAPTPSPAPTSSPSPTPGPKLRLVSNTPNPVSTSNSGSLKPQLKIVKENFRNKLNEKRKLQEVAPALAIPLVAGAAARFAAPHLGRLATKYAPTIAKSLGVGVATKLETDRMKDAEEKSLARRTKADERDAAEIARASSISAKLPEIPTTGDDIKLQTPPKIDSGKKVETPAATQAAAAPTPVAQPADVVGVATAAAAGAAAQTRATSKATPKTDAPAATKVSTTPRQSGDKKTKTPRARGFGIPDFKAGPEEPVKYSEPGAFSLKANITGPKPDDTTETRREKERQAFFKEQEEMDDEKRRLVQQIIQQQERKKRSFSLKANVSAPKGSSYNPARDEKQRQAVFRQSQMQEQTLIDQLKMIKDQDANEYIININESNVMINSTIANKIVNVYESLNNRNKAKFERLLNESSESFKKVVNFSLRQ